MFTLMNSKVDFLQDFINYLKRKKRSKSTINSYTTDLKQIASTNLNKSIVDFGENDLKYALSYLRSKNNLSPKSLSRKINSIRTYFKFLFLRNIIKENVAKKVPHPRFRNKKPKTVTRMEYLALKECARSNPKVFTMIEVLVQTGIKISELANLRIKDVDLTSQTLTVENNGQIRKIYINNKLLETLEKYMSQLKKRKDGLYLFHTRKFKPMKIRNIRSSIDRIITKAKIKDLCVNDLRNTFIIYQLNKGLPLFVLSKMVGHKHEINTKRYLGFLSKKYSPVNTEKPFEVLE